MAVVQISRIQLRRGRKLLTGIPQLASGELAWAIDTQELYIGNGAVSEGAPAVGNTKVLTEHDSILDLLEQYQYKPNDTNIQTSIDVNLPVERTLQARLDEGRVNAQSYNILGTDATVDQTTQIQNAIYNLYMTTSIANRVALEFDPGVYKITGTIYIPSNVYLIGAGKDKTIFSFVQGGINAGTTLTLSGSANGELSKGIFSGSGTGVSTTTVTGTGSGATVIVEKTTTGISYASGTVVRIVQSGQGYNEGNQIKVLGSALGGADGINDLTITLTATGSINEVFNTYKMFEFINESSTKTVANVNSTTYNNQPKNIVMKEFTARTNYNNVKAFDFTNVRDSEFVNIKATGTNGSDDYYPGGNATVMPTIVSNSVALDMTALSQVVTCQRNKFIGFHAEGFTYGVYSDTEILNNTFDMCTFHVLYNAVAFGIDSGPLNLGPRKNTISNSLFDTISHEGIVVDKGYGNRSRGNIYVNVGNAGGGTSNNVSGIIKFAVAGNSSMHDEFDRAFSLGNNNDNSYMSEIEGHGLFTETKPTIISLPYCPLVTPGIAIRIPINTSTGVEIDYIFQSTSYSHMRKGTLSIAVDVENSSTQLVDEYDYVGDTDDDANLIFTTTIATVEDVKSLVIYYTNLNMSDINTFTYTYSILS